MSVSSFGERLPYQSNGGGEEATHAEFTPSPHEVLENPAQRENWIRSMGWKGLAIAGVPLAAAGIFVGVWMGDRETSAGTPPYESSATPFETTTSTTEVLPKFRDRSGKEIQPADISRMAKIFVQPGETLESAGRRFATAIDNIANIQGNGAIEEGSLDDGVAQEIKDAYSLMVAEKPGYNKQIESIDSFETGIFNARVTAEKTQELPFSITHVEVSGTNDAVRPDETVFIAHYKLAGDNLSSNQTRALAYSLSAEQDAATGQPRWKANHFDYGVVKK